MTGDIVVRPGTIFDHGWEFHVSIAGERYLIRVTQDYWTKLTHRNIAPLSLVELALNEARRTHRLEALPGSFSLDTLDALVPNFEANVRAAAQAEAAANPR